MRPPRAPHRVGCGFATLVLVRAMDGEVPCRAARGEDRLNTESGGPSRHEAGRADRSTRADQRPRSAGADQIRTSLCASSVEPEPVAILVPSGLTARHRTGYACPCSTSTHSPVLASQMRTV